MPLLKFGGMAQAGHSSHGWTKAAASAAADSAAAKITIYYFSQSLDLVHVLFGHKAAL